MLDAFTIRREKGTLDNLKVAIVGDILHSRVARSQVQALNTLGVSEIRVIAPRTLLPTQVERLGVIPCTDMREGLDGVDVVMMLRLQIERMEGTLIASEQEYFYLYGLTEEKLAYAKPDAIVTVNWGTDMILLGQELGKAGVDVPIYTLYGAFAGTTSAIGEAGNGKIHLVHGGEYNPAPPRQAELYRAFKQEHPDSDLSSLRLIYTIEFLAKVIEKAGTADPLQVALAMEGMEYEAASGQMVKMRKSGDQIIQTLGVSVQTNEGIEFDISNTGIGLKTVNIVEAEKLARLPTSCNMQRPSQQIAEIR